MFVLTYLFLIVVCCLLLYLFSLPYRRATVRVKNCSMQAEYHVRGTSYMFAVFKMSLKINNFTSRQLLVHRFQARFFDGEKFSELVFEGYSVSPADIVMPRLARVFYYTLLSPMIHLQLPMQHPQAASTLIEVTFYVETKKKVIVVGGKDFVFDQAVA
jgi:hypothetical protein